MIYDVIYDSIKNLAEGNEFITYMSLKKPTEQLPTCSPNKMSYRQMQIPMTHYQLQVMNWENT